MQAVRFHRFGGPEVLVMEELPDLEPAGDEAVVDVAACGVNHLDLDLRAGVSGYPVSLPHILGYEVVGIIRALPDGYRGPLKRGDRVLASVVPACGECVACLEGRTNHCVETRLPGIHRPGGYATQFRYPARHLLPIPDQCPDVYAAALQLSFGTAWHALLDRGRLRPNDWLLIDAVGSGVGHAALQIARMCGARVIGCSHTPEKLRRAREHGCDVTVHLGSDDVQRVVNDVTRGRGADVVLSCVGGPLLRTVSQAAAPGGRIVVVGAHGGEQVEVDLIDLFRREVAILGSKRATLPDIKAVLQCVAEGRLKPEIADVLPLSQAQVAHQRLQERSLYGKLVLVV